MTAIQRRSVARTPLARVLGLCALSFACALPIASCGDSRPATTTRGAPGGARDRADREAAGANDSTASGPARTGANAQNGQAASEDDNRPPPLALTEADFSESDRTRDPFRSFAREFVPQGPVVTVDEHAIKLREFALESLQLVAVILGTDAPYAMVVDTTGRGTIIRRGEYVGRPDTVAGGDGLMPHQVPWRVSRIVGSRVSRDEDNNLTEVPGEVVFEREDRLNASGGHAERVLSLNRDAQANRPQDPGTTQSPLPTLPGFGPGGTPFLPTAPIGGAAAANAAAGGSRPPGGPVPPGGATFVQSYTTVTPPQPAQQPAPTTVVIQTGPQGQTTVTPASGNGTGARQGNQAPAPYVPTGPRDPYGAPGGPNAGPGIPPVQISDGPTGGSAPLPTSGLPR